MIDLIMQKIKQITLNKLNSDTEVEPRSKIILSPVVPDEDVESDFSDKNISTVNDSLGLAFYMIYKDVKGEESKRRITIRTLHHSSKGDILLKTYCHERKAVRSFRASRIQQFIDLQTGEVISDATDYLRQYTIHENTTDKTNAILKEYRYALAILVFFARSDGRLENDEIDLIMEFVLDNCEGMTFVNEKVRKHISNLHPDTYLFRNALQNMKSNEFPNIEKYITRLAELDGAISEGEFNLIMDLKEIVKESRVA